MITLTLLHPVQLTPIQSWSFEDEAIVRIGRAVDNHVVLYSAVVSRSHAELRRTDQHWEIINLGANGTYLDGKRITQAVAKDGVIIRLARSGPNLQIHIGNAAQAKVHSTTGKATIPQRIKPDLEEDSAGKPEAATQPTVTPPLAPSRKLGLSQQQVGRKTLLTCSHPQAAANLWFCLDCGAPLRKLKTVGEYQLLKLLEQSDTILTYLAWIQGKTVMLKTLTTDCMNQSAAVDRFEQEAKLLYDLNHPDIPRWLDFLTISGRPYLAIEILYGQTLLQRVLQLGKVAPAQAIAWMIELCDILDYLHRQPTPILDRAIQPTTILCRSMGIPKRQIALLDFGTLKFSTAPPRRSAISYLAPEQQQGHLTPTSNLFSLGVTLAFLLSAQEPTAFYIQREQGYRFYAEYVPGLSPELIPVIRKLTHPDPNDRYQSAGEVAAVLQEISL